MNASRYRSRWSTRNFVIICLTRSGGTPSEKPLHARSFTAWMEVRRRLCSALSGVQRRSGEVASLDLFDLGAAEGRHLMVCAAAGIQAAAHHLLKRPPIC